MLSLGFIGSKHDDSDENSDDGGGGGGGIDVGSTQTLPSLDNRLSYRFVRPSAPPKNCWFDRASDGDVHRQAICE
jgi:hypothetical protein